MAPDGTRCSAPEAAREYIPPNSPRALGGTHCSAANVGAREYRPSGQPQRRQEALGCNAMPSAPPQAPSGETRGPFTLDVFNCMFGTSATNMNSFAVGDVASCAPAQRQHYPGSAPNDYNQSEDHAVIQT
eukprot:1995973-Pyramimonas_sp.AAC.1